MGFKLGKGKRPSMIGGNIRTKMRFGQEAGESDISVPGTPVIRKPLAERQVINHEMRHSTDMKLGKLAYDDDSITYNGDVFPRKEINGKDMILIDGQWKEAGDHGFPWEDDANNGSEPKL